MKEKGNIRDTEYRLLNAVRHRELHGDGNVEYLAELAKNKRFSLRLDMEEAAQQCKEWITVAPQTGVRAWRQLREGVYGLQVSLKLRVQEAGRLAGSWGEDMREALSPVIWPIGAQPQLVALGEGDDLQARSAMAVITAGDSALSCNLHLFSRKDRSVTVELRITPVVSSADAGWSAELWRGSEPLQRIPIERGIAVFTKALTPGAYHIVVCAEGKRYELEIEVA